MHDSIKWLFFMVGLPGIAILTVGCGDTQTTSPPDDLTIVFAAQSVEGCIAERPNNGDNQLPFDVNTLKARVARSLYIWFNLVNSFAIEIVPVNRLLVFIHYYYGV